MTLPIVSLYEAMTNPNILGDRFAPTVSWAPWGVVARAMGATLTPGPLGTFYAEHTGRRRLPSTPCRELWIASGRRSGKSRFAALIAVWSACFRTYNLAPGETGVVMLIAADRKQARVLKGYVMGLLDAPILRGMVERETREGIRLTNGIVVEIHTASFRTVRGYSIIAAILDEVAYWSSDEMAADPDTEIVAALRPALATTNGLLVALSSPYAKRGALYQAWSKHFGVADSPVLFWQSASRDMNASLPAHVIEDAYLDDPVSARSEWGGEWRADVETFISREAVEAVIATGVREIPPGLLAVAATDMAGGSGRDSAALAIAGLSDSGQVALMHVEEFQPPFNPAEATAAFCETLKRYGCTSVVGDQWARGYPAAGFAEHGITYVDSDRNRSDIYLSFLPLVMSQRVQLLDLPKLKNQLLALERRPGKNGRDSVDHPPGASSHDDLINAVALAVVKLAGSVQVQVQFRGDVNQTATEQGFEREPFGYDANSVADPDEDLGEHRYPGVWELSKRAAAARDGDGFAPALTRRSRSASSWRRFGGR